MHDNPIIRAEVNLAAIGENVRQLRSATDKKASLAAVVKANAYGHGAIPVARTALENGADWLAVARIEEALPLRKAGICAPILIFGYTPAFMAKRLIEHDLRQTVHSLENARNLSHEAEKIGRKIKVHVKADTGMGRLGLLTNQGYRAISGIGADDGSPSEIEKIARLPGLSCEGIMTHFASSDSEDKSHARRQLRIFTELIDKLKERKIEFAIRHAANSGAIIDMPEAHLDMVRPGISLYGLYPSDKVDKTRVKLVPAMSLIARIVQLKRVPAGFPVSYSSTYKTLRPTTIATVAAGYADGLNRLLSSKGHMLVRGQRAPIIGRVCMDLTMLDVGHIPEVSVENEAVIFGTQGKNAIHVDEIAAMLSTINYEVVSSITARVPRHYS